MDNKTRLDPSSDSELIKALEIIRKSPVPIRGLSVKEEKPSLVIGCVETLKNAVDSSQKDGDDCKATVIGFRSTHATMYGRYTAVELREIADQLEGS